MEACVMADKDTLVWSSQAGDLRKKEKSAPRPSSGMKRDGIVRVQKESKGRGGKTVSVIYGLPLSGAALSAIAPRLKQKCGTGGTVRDGTVIIQGDKVDEILRLLSQEGFAVKRAGG
jgi:translation initiation factor 1